MLMIVISKNKKFILDENTIQRNMHAERHAENKREEGTFGVTFPHLTRATADNKWPRHVGHVPGQQPRATIGAACVKFRVRVTGTHSCLAPQKNGLDLFPQFTPGDQHHRD